MNLITYRYTQVGTGDEVRYRPLVDVTVLAPNGEAVQVAALVDSGADFCLFPLTTAGMLSLKVESLPTAITFGVGSVSNLTYFDDLVLDLGNGVIFTTRVGFTEGMDRAGFGLLGQMGFFENYNVEFRYRQRTFTIQTV
jgi:hypothetical protein